MNMDREEWIKKYAGKKILVIGAGLSGVGSVHLACEIGAKPILLEQNEQKKESEIRSGLHESDRQRCDIVIGKLSNEQMEQLTLCVPSPVVALDTPFMDDLRNRGVEIISEVEFAFRFAKGKLLAITGTNGKTTTTSLVYAIMKSVCKKVFLVGNIGFSYAERAMETDDESVTVAEISSFQLEAVQAFHADVSAILNITPDHLNRHHTMENYIGCKEQIARNESKEDTCVLNRDNVYTWKFAKECPAHTVLFSSQEKLENGLFLDGDQIILAKDGKSECFMRFSESTLVGICNAENIMAAIAICLAAGVEKEQMLPVIRQFRAVPHRIEYVATKGGVSYYNDSKATNPDAAIQGIRAMDVPTILIAGGYDKGNSYDDWIKEAKPKVKELVLIGQTAPQIAACAQKYGIKSLYFAETFDEALKHCTEIAKEGDAVLLSPACASWGMFENYEQRGDLFKEYVNQL